MNYVYKKSHDYLFLNVDSQKYFKDFDELIIHKNKDEEENDI